MVQVVKFSQFPSGGTFTAGDIPVGLQSGINTQWTAARQFVPDFTTATRPSPPSGGMIGYNTTIADFEYYNGTAWIAVNAGGGGSVTNVGTGAGLTGGPITSTGTISLASIADDNLLANISGSSNPPSANTLSAIIDDVIDNTQGDILYRNATIWTNLAPGTAGQVLISGGASANPSWSSVGAGTVTSIATNNGITGGTITSTGTIGLANINNVSILSNISGGAATPIQNSLTAIIDACIDNTQGDILYRNSTIWTNLAPGTAGQVLTSGGAAANVSWSSVGSGTVTSVATSTGLQGGTITTTGTISFAAIAATSFWANVTGSSAVPTVQSLSILLQSANNLSDVASATTSFNNISPLTTKGDLITYNSGNVRLAVGSAGNLMYVSSGLPAWLATSGSGVLITSAGGTPSINSTLPATVQTNITELGTQSQALNMGTNLINNVTNPVNPQDAATKFYVDQSILTGTSVYAASAANLTVTQSGAGVGATLTNAGATSYLRLG